MQQHCIRRIRTPAHMDDVTIREATPADAGAISALITALLDCYLRSDLSKDGEAGFRDMVAPETLADVLAGDAYRYHVAVEQGHIIGVVGVRRNLHLYHLFVTASHHRRGVASRLWEHAQRVARAAGNEGRFTVNSSTYGLPLYRRLGFVQTGPAAVKDGVTYTPMELIEEI